MTTTKRRKSIRSDSKSLIYNTIRVCNHKAENDFLILIAKASKQAIEVDMAV